jgi:hypothetical protein
MTAGPFNLAEFMFSYFSRVDFGGDLFSQWPIGLRFEIGEHQVSRAVKLFEFIFRDTEDCILISQDWSSDLQLAEPHTPLFATPGVFPYLPPLSGPLMVSPYEESQYQLLWTRLSAASFDVTRIFQGIANRERPGTPKVASAVYVLDENSKLIMHMYDDRGLDVIAHASSTLLPICDRFGDWIVDNQRRKTSSRFGTLLSEADPSAPPSQP